MELFGDGKGCWGGDGALGEVVGGVDPVQSGGTVSSVPAREPIRVRVLVNLLKIKFV